MKQNPAGWMVTTGVRLSQGFVVLLLAGAFWTGSCTSGSAALTFQFATYFSGTPPNTPTPWMTATLQQAAANQVQLTISLPNNLPAGTFLDTFYFNYDPTKDASFLAITGPGIQGKTGGAVTWNAANNAFKADGDGNYDLQLSFPTSQSSPYQVAAPDTVCYDINGPNGGNITPSSFLYSSVGGAKGSFYMAAHIQGYGNGAWVAVPESGDFGMAAGWALVGIGALWCWRNRARRPAP